MKYLSLHGIQGRAQKISKPDKKAANDSESMKCYLCEHCVLDQRQRKTTLVRFVCKIKDSPMHHGLLDQNERLQYEWAL